jgi:hypothetical protein
MNSLSESINRAAVWIKGREIPGYDSTVWRHDAFGSVMRYADYGNRQSEYGWEIDHVVPSALGGIDAHANYRPLNCRNNAGLGGMLGNALGKR